MHTHRTTPRFAAAITLAIAVTVSLSVLSAQAQEVSPKTAEQPFAPLAGTWRNRDAVLTVDGISARLRWKTGSCDNVSVTVPCDEEILGVRFYGGLIEMAFTHMTDEPRAAHGKVVLTNRPDWFERGKMVVLTQEDDNRVTLMQLVVPAPGEQPPHVALCRVQNYAGTCDE